MDHPGTRAAGAGAGVLEERHISPCACVFVCVEEVVNGRVVLVDRFLDQPQTHHPGVKSKVAWRVSRDGGDVVDAVELLHLPGYTAPTQYFVPAAHPRLCPRLPGRARKTLV